jgi:aminotransferase
MRDFVARHVAALPPSGIRKYFDIAAEMQNVISLGIGEPDFVTPPRIVRAGIESLQRGETKYTSNSGTIELRRVVADQLQRFYGVPYDPNSEVLITVGVSEALALACAAAIDPGDEVIVPEPCFVAYAAEVALHHGIPVTVPTFIEDDFQVTAERIAAAITPRTKALLIGYPNNPTGAVMNREHLLAIAELVEKHDLLVISDELYEQLVYDTEHICFASLPNMRKRTILLGGFSKHYSMTGWRVGYAAAPATLLEAMRKIHQYHIMSAPTTSQVAALEAIRAGSSHVAGLRDEYNRRRRLIVDGLNQLGLTCFEPRGAFYCFPSIEASGMDEHTFAEKLLREESVAVVPGSAFGPSGKGYVRCAYTTHFEKLEEALDRIARFMRKYG